MRSKLSPNTILRRALDIHLELPTPDRARVKNADSALECSTRVLAVLDEFAYPRTFADGLARLQKKVTGALEWIELTQLVTELHSRGFLLDETDVSPALENKPSFGAPYIHVRMLNDKARTEAYLQAIREVVKPGDTVLDLGTGTGVLAVAAAKQGARHVYAIEATTIGAAARELFAANQLADRISLISGWSTQVELPEKVDVLISEILGNDPLGENIREITCDARRRFLKPSARLIPNNVRVMAQVVTAPDDFIRERIFTPETCAKWLEWYDIDFSSLCVQQARTVNYAFIRPHTARGWRRIGQPVTLVDVPMTADRWEPIQTVKRVAAGVDGEVNAAIEYFEADLCPGIGISDSPWVATEECNWNTRVWLTAEPFRVQSGDAFELSFRHSAPGQRDSLELHECAPEGDE